MAAISVVSAQTSCVEINEYALIHDYQQKFNPELHIKVIRFYQSKQFLLLSCKIFRTNLVRFSRFLLTFSYI